LHDKRRILSFSFFRRESLGRSGYQPISSVVHCNINIYTVLCDSKYYYHKNQLNHATVRAIVHVSRVWPAENQEKHQLIMKEKHRNCEFHASMIRHDLIVGYSQID
jgi:hypothetical protein